MTTRIVTSSFKAHLPPTILKVSVARGVPRGYPAGYKTYRRLAPGRWFSTASQDLYRKLYFDEVLGPLDPERVVMELSAMNPGGTVALLCWETAFDGKYCHRGYVSEWMHDKLGLEVVEYETPEEGFGKSHPKLPADFRVASRS